MLTDNDNADNADNMGNITAAVCTSNRILN